MNGDCPADACRLEPLFTYDVFIAMSREVMVMLLG